MELTSSADIVAARLRGQELARGVGFSRMDSTLIATVISELAHDFMECGHAQVRLNEAASGVRRGIRVQLTCATAGCISANRMPLERLRTVLDNVEVATAPTGTTLTLIKLLPARRERRLRVIRAGA